MKIRLTDDDVRPFVPASLTQERTRRFLTCIRDNPFVCVAFDDKEGAVKIFTKGEENMVADLIECLNKETDGYDR